MEPYQETGTADSVPAFRSLPVTSCPLVQILRFQILKTYVHILIRPAVGLCRQTPAVNNRLRRLQSVENSHRLSCGMMPKSNSWRASFLLQ